MGTRQSSDATLLRKHTLRATPHRLLVLAVLRKQGKPLSVADIVAAARGAFDITTAYRTLDAFEKKGIVRTLTLTNERALYELADDHHHHAVCTNCGKIVDISLCVSPAFRENVRKTAGFSEMTAHSLEFYGLCRACRKKSYA